MGKERAVEVHVRTPSFLPKVIETNTVLDEVMRSPIQLQCIFPYTTLVNPEVEPHAPNTYQSKLVPSDSINSNKCEGSTSRS